MTENNQLTSLIPETLSGDSFEITRGNLNISEINSCRITPSDTIPFIFRGRDDDELVIFIGTSEEIEFNSLDELESFAGARENGKTNSDGEFPEYLVTVKFPERMDGIYPLIQGRIVVPAGVLKVSKTKINGKLLVADSHELSLLFFHEMARILDEISGESDSDLIDSISVRIISATESKADFIKWNDSIKTILEGLSDGKFSKLVLSREKSFSAEEEISAKYLWSKLNNLRSGSYKFLIKDDNELFFGASPERLFRIENGVIETEALAGTFSDTSDDPDKEKNYREHLFVRDYITTQLKTAVESVGFSETPVIRKHEKIYHYCTPVTAKLNHGESYTALLGLLFPTPAIAGTPLENVISEIPVIEKYKRGYYAGATGIVYGNGNSEFFVNLRCGSYSEKTIKLFAGCGIVKGSESEKEFAESQSKMRTMLSLFAYEN